MIEDHQRACELVIDRIETALATVVPDGPLAGPTKDLLDGVRATFAATAPNNVVSVHVPLTFVTPDKTLDDATDLIGVAAACSALYIGARLLDDLMDGHDVSYFAQEQSSLDVLRWATFLSIVPPLLLAQLECDASVRVQAIEDLSTGMAVMASGQLGDVRAQAALPSTAEALDAIRGKTGSLIGTFATCAARVSGMDDGVIEHIARFCMALGVGRQLVNDRQKFDGLRRSHDGSPVPAYLVALHAESLSDTDRLVFAEKLEAAKTDPTAGREVVEQIATSGAHAEAFMAAEMELAMATTSIAAIADTLPDHVTSRFEAMVEAASMLPTRR